MATEKPTFITGNASAGFARAATEADTIMECAIDASEVRQQRLDGVGAIALPSHYAIHTMEPLQELRNRMRGTYATSSLEDFAAYVKRRAEEAADTNQPQIFLDEDNRRATAFFNLGNAIYPGHGDDIAVLKLDPPAEWGALRILDGKTWPQLGLIEFIEDWANNFTHFKAQDSTTLTYPQAVSAIRKITVDHAKRVNHEVEDTRRERGILETVEVRSASTFPTGAIFNARPATILPAMDVQVRILPNPNTDVVTFRTRIVSFDKVMEQANEAFVDAITKALPFAVYRGTYQVKP